MSKTVYLLDDFGHCVAFGAGMVIFTGPMSVRVGNTNGGSTWETALHATASPRASVAKWAHAIATAPEGALLRWDKERECVTDKLAPEDAFAEEVAA